MSLDFYFVYETNDAARLEVKPVVCRGLQDLFEYPSRFEELKDTVLNPEFVQDFPKLSDAEPEEIDFEGMSEEDWDEMLEPYVGPSFEPQEVVAWAGNWIEIINELDDDGRRAVLPLATYGYDWTPQLLDDLQQIVEQGQCAECHNLTMHIEMY